MIEKFYLLLLMVRCDGVEGPYWQGSGPVKADVESSSLSSTAQ